ncbi:unnamed protein product [Aphanomyces euteiches]
MNKQLAVVQELLARGANADAGDWSYRGAFSWRFRGLNNSGTSQRTLCWWYLLCQSTSTGGLLCFALPSGLLNVVTTLLDHDADVNKRNYAGCTPLYQAAKKGFVDVVKELLSRGASTNVFDFDRNTPLHWAAGRGQVEMVDEIKAKKLPLHIAAKKGRLAVMELLVNAGADVSAINKKRERAYDLGSEEIKAWFKRMNTIETTLKLLEVVPIKEQLKDKKTIKDL